MRLNECASGGVFVVAKLVFRSGPYAGKSVSLPTGKTIVLGRNRDIDLPLPDLKLSRRHCQITFADDQVTVKDLNSTNGTFLNGTRVTEETVLNPFDRVVVGDTEIEYHETEKAAEDFVAPVGSHDSATTTRQQPQAAVPVAAVANVPTAVPVPSAATVRQAGPSPLELAIREMMLPLPPEPVVDSTPAQIERPKVFFCDMCNASIPVADWQLGNAKEFEGKNFCKDCLAKGVVVGEPLPKPKGSTTVPSKNKSMDDILAGLNDEAIVVDTTLKRRGVAVKDEQVAESISKFERDTNQPAPQKVPSERRAAVQVAAAAPAKPIPKPAPRPAPPPPAAPSNLEPLGDEFEEIG